QRYTSEITKILSQIKAVNKNCQQELYFIDNIRYNILNRIATSIENNKKAEAASLFNLMDKYANEITYPYQDENGKKYADNIRGQM
ncbi:MAG TPA: hypothetical protein VNW99_10215, partial [Cytophagaceae bacterium]|nr:hypothetical protein [Cytophagaceae bacterium]